MNRLRLFVVLSVLLCLLTGAAFACDEALLSLITSETPDKVFVEKLNVLNATVSQIGNALSEGRQGQFDPLMMKLMDAWIEFSGKYVYNPPDLAKEDQNWEEKIKNIGLRIGQVRKLIQEKKIPMAHDEVFALDKDILRLFDCVKISEEKRAYITGGELIEGMDEFGGRGNALAIKACLNDFVRVVASLTPPLATEGRLLFARVNASAQTIGQLTESASGTNFIQLVPMLHTLKNDYYDLEKHFFPKEKGKAGLQNETASSGGTL